MRTAVGVAALVFFVDLTLASATDLIGNGLQIRFERLIEILQYGSFIGPIVGGLRRLPGLPAAAAHGASTPSSGPWVASSSGTPRAPTTPWVPVMVKTVMAKTVMAKTATAKTGTAKTATVKTAIGADGHGHGEHPGPGPTSVEELARVPATPAGPGLGAGTPGAPPATATLPPVPVPPATTSARRAADGDRTGRSGPLPKSVLNTHMAPRRR